MKKIKSINYANMEGYVVSTFPDQQTKKINLIWLILAGLLIGWVNGFWGGGGGMICVPVLISLLKLPEKRAHATTLLVMLPLSICSFVVYLLKGSVDVKMSLVVGVGFVVGGVLGAMILKNINNIVLRLVFALVIIAGGVKMLL